MDTEQYLKLREQRVHSGGRREPCRPAGSGTDTSQPGQQGGGQGRPGRRQMMKGLDFNPQGRGNHRYSLSKGETCPNTRLERRPVLERDSED